LSYFKEEGQKRVYYLNYSKYIYNVILAVALSFSRMRCHMTIVFFCFHSKSSRYGTRETVGAKRLEN